MEHKLPQGGFRNKFPNRPKIKPGEQGALTGDTAGPFQDGGLPSWVAATRRSGNSAPYADNSYGRQGGASNPPSATEVVSRSGVGGGMAVRPIAEFQASLTSIRIDGQGSSFFQLLKALDGPTSFPSTMRRLRNDEVRINTQLQQAQERMGSLRENKDKRILYREVQSLIRQSRANLEAINREQNGFQSEHRQALDALASRRRGATFYVDLEKFSPAERGRLEAGLPLLYDRLLNTGVMSEDKQAFLRRSRKQQNRLDQLEDYITSGGKTGVATSVTGAKEEQEKILQESPQVVTRQEPGSYSPMSGRWKNMPLRHVPLGHITWLAEGALVKNKETGKSERVKGLADTQINRARDYLNSREGSKRHAEWLRSGLDSMSGLDVKVSDTDSEKMDRGSAGVNQLLDNIRSTVKRDDLRRLLNELVQNPDSETTRQKLRELAYRLAPEEERTRKLRELLGSRREINDMPAGPEKVRALQEHKAELARLSIGNQQIDEKMLPALRDLTNRIRTGVGLDPRQEGTVGNTIRNWVSNFLQETSGGPTPLERRERDLVFQARQKVAKDLRDEETNKLLLERGENLLKKTGTGMHFSKDKEGKRLKANYLRLLAAVEDLKKPETERKFKNRGGDDLHSVLLGWREPVKEGEDKGQLNRGVYNKDATRKFWSEVQKRTQFNLSKRLEDEGQIQLRKQGYKRDENVFETVTVGHERELFEGYIKRGMTPEQAMSAARKAINESDPHKPGWDKGDVFGRATLSKKQKLEISLEDREAEKNFLKKVRGFGLHRDMLKELAPQLRRFAREAGDMTEEERDSFASDLITNYKVSPHDLMHMARGQMTPEKYLETRWRGLTANYRELQRGNADATNPRYPVWIHNDYDRKDRSDDYLTPQDLLPKRGTYHKAQEFLEENLLHPEDRHKDLDSKWTSGVNKQAARRQAELAEDIPMLTSRPEILRFMKQVYQEFPGYHPGLAEGEEGAGVANLLDQAMDRWNIVADMSLTPTNDLSEYTPVEDQGRQVIGLRRNVARMGEKVAPFEEAENLSGSHEPGGRLMRLLHESDVMEEGAHLTPLEQVRREAEIKDDMTTDVESSHRDEKQVLSRFGLEPMDIKGFDSMTMVGNLEEFFGGLPDRPEGEDQAGAQKTDDYYGYSYSEDQDPYRADPSSYTGIGRKFAATLPEKQE